MTEDDSSIRLLADLLKLLKKHGERSFHSLAEALRNPALASTLTTILEETPKRVTIKKPAKKPPTDKKAKSKSSGAPTSSLQQWSDIILPKSE